MEKSNSKFWLGFFVGLAAISLLCFLGLLIFVFSQGESVDLAQQVEAQQNEQNNAAAEPEQEQPAAVPPITGDEPVLGDRNAKVKIIEYSDFECPYSFQHEATMKKIRNEYGDKVAIIFRNFPLSFHQNAQKAAEAAECAAEQGKFWQMHDKLFALNNEQDMGVDQFKAAAAEIGLDANKFNECLDSGEMASEVSKDMIGGQKAGVSGTPGTFINGKLISGALPYEQFKSIIDELLAQ